MSVVLIPVGSLRARHIYGVNRLPTEYLPVKVYVLATSDPSYAKGRLSVWRNADAVAQELDAVDLIRMNTLSEADVAKTFMEIYERENHPSTVLVDITSTTKTVVGVTLVFSILFGFKPYSVRAKKSYPNIERSRRILNRLFAQDTDLAAIKRCMQKYETAPAAALRDLRRLLEERTSEIGYDLKAESPGIELVITKLPVLKQLELQDSEKRALVKLFESKDSGSSVKGLAEAIGISGKSKQLSFGYRIDKLESRALVSTEAEGKQKRVTLTSIGTGVAEALSRKRARSSSSL